MILRRISCQRITVDKAEIQILRVGNPRESTCLTWPVTGHVKRNANAEVVHCHGINPVTLAWWESVLPWNTLEACKTKYRYEGRHSQGTNLSALA